MAAENNKDKHKIRSMSQYLNFKFGKGILINEVY